MLKSEELQADVVEKKAISSCITRSMLNCPKLEKEVDERKAKFCGCREENEGLLRMTTRLKSEKLRSEAVKKNLQFNCVTRSMADKSSKEVTSHTNKWTSSYKWRKNTDAQEWRNKSRINHNYEIGVKACKLRASIATKNFVKALPRLNRWEKSDDITKQLRIPVITATKSIKKSIPRINLRQKMEKEILNRLRKGILESAR
jgi:hypothetical protein